jgi:hypothetical protein
MAEQGQLGPSWHHQQQRQRLEAALALLGQTELPARLEQLARFDAEPAAAGGDAAQEARALLKLLETIGESRDEAARTRAMADALSRARRLVERLG